jgi:hypothetical protein
MAASTRNGLVYISPDLTEAVINGRNITINHYTAARYDYSNPNEKPTKVETFTADQLLIRAAR